jgi:hypothetical protein
MAGDRRIGLHDPTEEQVAAAMEANRNFVARLEQIRDAAQEPMQ